MLRSKSSYTDSDGRRGLAALELAVSLPVIVVLVFAAMESCTMVYVTQGLHAAAYEGARVAITHGGTTSQAVQRAQQIADGHGLVGTSISCVPTDVSTAHAGDTVTVVVSASCDANRVCPSFFFAGRTIAIRTTMAKE
jgi:Flp pilus assembly protein TadG